MTDLTEEYAYAMYRRRASSRENCRLLQNLTLKLRNCKIPGHLTHQPFSPCECLSGGQKSSCSKKRGCCEAKLTFSSQLSKSCWKARTSSKPVLCDFVPSQFFRDCYGLICFTSTSYLSLFVLVFVSIVLMPVFLILHSGMLFCDCYFHLAFAFSIESHHNLDFSMLFGVVAFSCAY